MDIADMVAGSGEQTTKVEAIKDLELPEETVAKLEAANLTMVEQLKGLSVADMAGIEGIGEDEAQQIAEQVAKSG